jgi:hypothetical protein
MAESACWLNVHLKAAGLQRRPSTRTGSVFYHLSMRLFTRDVEIAHPTLNGDITDRGKAQPRYHPNLERSPECSCELPGT